MQISLKLYIEKENNLKQYINQKISKKQKTGLRSRETNKKVEKDPKTVPKNGRKSKKGQEAGL